MTSKHPKVRVNTTITGEPAKILLEIKRRGLATSNTGVIITALKALHEKILEADLKQAQLKTLETRTYEKG